MLGSAFPSFFLGGFECSTHRRPSGRRVDVIDASGHDRHAHADYARLRAAGLLAARDGLRWHLIERGGSFDFSSAGAQLSAARETGVQVIWDLMHYGYPDDLSPFDPDFPARFARYARAATEYLRAGTRGRLWLCPVNELSFLAWGGGDVAYLNPFARGRGDELKTQLVRASLAGMDAAREVDPEVGFLHAEPMIHVRAHPGIPPEFAPEVTHAQHAHEAQFAALDWLTGRARPELGGAPHYADLIGVNLYPYNQWWHREPPHGQAVIPFDHPDYVPVSEQLRGLHERYGLPLLIAETGAENELRAPWLEMVTREVLRARAEGVPVGGICLYPVVNHPGWDDDRHCHNGLWDYADARGERTTDPDYARALAAAQAEVTQALGGTGGPTPPPPRVSRRVALARLGQAAPVIRGEAAARDADGQFPLASFAALREAGVLTLTLPRELGGGGLGARDLLWLLRAVGRLSLPVARVLEGHFNALGLVVRYGSPEQARAAAEDAHAGELFGVWNTEEAPGLRLHGGELTGNKTFTSGAQFVTRALCPAEGPDGRQMVLLRDLPPERFDAGFWQPAGMRATVSARVDLSGLKVSARDLIGPPGAYYEQPDFSGGALRFLAAQLGGAQAAVQSVRVGLQRLGRAEDDVQRLRFAPVAAGLEGAWQVVLTAQARLGALSPDSSSGHHSDALGPALEYVSLARLLTEDACLAAAEACERAAGARGLLPPVPTERLLRDLRLYLRQPAPDAARLQVGAALLGAPEDTADPFEWAGLEGEA